MEAQRSRIRLKQRNLPHGGDWAGFEIEYGKEPLDFSMNVNPLGIPEEVRLSVTKSLDKADRYPDPLCRKLRKAVAEKEGVPEEWLFFGNGASEIIYRLGAVLGKRLLITAPTFSEYEKSFRAQGWQVERYMLEEDKGFRVREDILDLIRRNETATGALHGGPDALFLCEPNNPTGVTTDPVFLKKIAEKCGQTGTWLVVDECFNGFLDDPEKHSLMNTVREAADNRTGRIIILKAFTKLYGMAGIRLGYCICPDRRIIEALENAGPAWNVSSVAQDAGVAALAQDEYVEEARRIVRTEREWLKEQLRHLGMRSIYGEANYILFREETVPDDEKAQDRAPDENRDPGGTLVAKVREQGILIRDCSNYHGLGPGWYRVAVKIHAENEILIEAMIRASDE